MVNGKEFFIVECQRDDCDILGTMDQLSKLVTFIKNKLGPRYKLTDLPEISIILLSLLVSLVPMPYDKTCGFIEIPLKKVIEVTGGLYESSFAVDELLAVQAQFNNSPDGQVSILRKFWIDDDLLVFEIDEKVVEHFRLNGKLTCPLFRIDYSDPMEFI